MSLGVAERVLSSRDGQASTGPAPSLQTQSKMMAYDRVISDFNATRLRGTSYPIIHALIEASLAVNTGVSRTSSQHLHALTVCRIAAG